MKYIPLLAFLLPSLASGEKSINQCFLATPYVKYCSLSNPNKTEDCLNTMLSRLQKKNAVIYSEIRQGLIKSPEFLKEFDGNYISRVKLLEKECAESRPTCYAEQAAFQPVICGIDGTVRHLEDLGGGSWRDRTEEIIHDKPIVVDERDSAAAWTKLLPQ